MALFMNAMTWFDHDTFSIWSQPWGTAITGPLKGTSLDLVPSTVVQWEAWRNEHPNTLVLDVPPSDESFYADRQRQFPNENYVIGAIFGEQVKGYWLPSVLDERVVNDAVGSFPVVIYGDPDTKEYSVYLRDTGNRLLTFTQQGNKLVDNETGSVWNPASGLASDGPLRGIKLQPVPTLTAFDWAWMTFYPDTEIYGYADRGEDDDTKTPGLS